MSIVVICPQCRADFEIPDDLADQPLRCHRCLHVFSKAARQTAAAGFLAEWAPHTAAASVQSMPQEASEPPYLARPRIPVVQVLVLALGLLVFLLAISVGFNVWMLFLPDRQRHLADTIQRAEKNMIQMHEQAAKAATIAQQQGIQAELKWQAVQRQNEDLKLELNIMREQLKDARPPAEK